MTASLTPKEQDSFAFMMSTEEHIPQAEGKLKFVLDSGATEHLINDLSFYKEYQQLEKPIKISVGKKEACIWATHVGNIEILTNLGHVGTLRKVLYAQEVPVNLLSVRRMQEAGISVIFNHNGEVIAKIGQKTIMTGKRMNELYILYFTVQNALPIQTNGQATIIRLENKDKLWHERLGHISKTKFANLKAKVLAEDSNYLNDVNPVDSLCESCINGKQTRLPFAKVKDKIHIQRPLYIVHSDVCGPITPPTIDSKNYFVNFIDAYTHYTVTYLMSHKSEVITCFKDYVAKSEAHFNQKIVHLYCDNGREYLSGEMREFCKQKGITYHLTVPYTPQQNSVAECMNRTLTEKARAMVHSAGLNKRFWGEAVLTAAYLVNRSPSKAIKTDKTPYELWHNQKPKLKFLRVFGCTAYVHNETRRHKFDDKSIKGILVGYVPNGYKIFIAKTRKFIVARDVIFDEVNFKTSRQELDDMIKIDRYLGENTDDLVQGTSTEEISVTGGTERGLRKKLDNKYCGPYRVTKLFGNDRYKIRSVKGMRGYKNFGAVVAVDALRPYHGLMGGENSDSGDSEDEIRDRQDLIDLLEG
jgi:transposase InsO family protein